MALASNWAIEKITVAAAGASSSSRFVTFLLRDKTTGTFSSQTADVPLATIQDAALLKTFICTTYNAGFTPNDFGCP